MDIQSFMDSVVYNEKGLVPVITQDDENGDVLMMAWMNEEALRLTLETRRMTYYSRSRKSLWVKGETSGHYQRLVSIAIDCDGDTLLARVIQQGAACHTGNRTCFYRKLDGQEG
ncbi:MAG TPA: phosphoribosyl-AMP cyclohydrolase [Clostridiaceae bacterium]|nr:phosphoribosyl-AMP cyclohydrolase [Clostridiaceae bacterium]